MQALETGEKSMELNAQTPEGDCGPSSGLADCKEERNAAPEDNVDSEREKTVLKIWKHFSLENDKLCGDLKESLIAPLDSEDATMHESSDDGGQATDVEVQMSTNAEPSQENASSASKLLVSSADDLDEMMDIGTVDQVDQEAQMEEEKQSKSQSLEGNLQSAAVSSAGEVKQSCFFLTDFCVQVYYVVEGCYFFLSRFLLLI